MKVSRRKNVHVRFEPDVDDGTTYAFNYHKDQLVIGREKMYRLYEFVSGDGTTIDDLMVHLVDISSTAEEKYQNEVDLLVDVTKLVDAQVLASTAN